MDVYIQKICYERNEHLQHKGIVLFMKTATFTSLSKQILDGLNAGHLFLLFLNAGNLSTGYSCPTRLLVYTLCLLVCSPVLGMQIFPRPSPSPSSFSLSLSPTLSLSHLPLLHLQSPSLWSHVTLIASLQRSSGSHRDKLQHVPLWLGTQLSPQQTHVTTLPQILPLF